MLFIYLPLSILALIIAVMFFCLYERDVCTILLCWLEALAEKRARKQLQVKDGSSDPTSSLTVHKSPSH
jgi:hypothetical protein